MKSTPRPSYYPADGNSYYCDKNSSITVFYPSRFPILSYTHIVSISQLYRTVTDDVTNYVAHRICNTNLWHFSASFAVKFDSKNLSADCDTI